MSSRHHTRAQRLAILERHLIDRVPISDTCRESRIEAETFHQWMREFFEAGSRAFVGDGDEVTSSSDRPEVSVVVPVHNEESNIEELHRRVSVTLRPVVSSFELIFVNDGSTDATGRVIESLQGHDPSLVAIHLSRNFGHQPAIAAGVRHARGDAVVVMDGDLQDRPEDVPAFIERWRRGYEVIYAIRTKRKESLFKRAGYFIFYRLQHATGDLDIPLDSGDFGLMDRRVVDVLNGLPEQMRFIRGLRRYAGFSQIGVECVRAERAGGQPQYSVRALFDLAVDGLVNFSSHPLRLATYGGIIAIAIVFVLSIWIVLDSVFNDRTPRGWASTVLVVLFLGSIQLVSLGIIGEYVRRIFIESKRRPGYIIDKVVRGDGRRSESEDDGKDAPDTEPG